LKKGLNLSNENGLRYQHNTEITIPSAESVTIIWKYFVLMASNRVGYDFPSSKTNLKKSISATHTPFFLLLLLKFQVH